MLLTFAICQDEVAARLYESLVFGLQSGVAKSATVSYCTVCTKRREAQELLFSFSSPKQIIHLLYNHSFTLQYCKVFCLFV